MSNKAVIEILHSTLREENKIEKLKTLLDSKVTEIDLSRSELNTKDAQTLAKALANNTTLTSLNLNSNKIGSEGLKALAQILATNTTLKSLELEFNAIQSEGAVALAQALKVNKGLENLNLGSNIIGLEGSLAIIKSLESNTSLKALNLKQTHMGLFEGSTEILTQILGTLLRTNKTLTSLNLRGNRIDYQAAKILAKSLDTNNTLSYLNLSDNAIDYRSAQELMLDLEPNIGLKHLELEVDSIQKKQIASFLQRKEEKRQHIAIEKPQEPLETSSAPIIPQPMANESETLEKNSNPKEVLPETKTKPSVEPPRASQSDKPLSFFEQVKAFFKKLWQTFNNLVQSPFSRFRKKPTSHTESTPSSLQSQPAQLANSLRSTEVVNSALSQDTAQTKSTNKLTNDNQRSGLSR